MSKGPLSGLKVIEMGQIAAGPFTGMLLADLGADVVKIERPGTGDGMREWPPLVEKDDNIYSENFASLNRNKRSVTINFKENNDLQKLKKLCDKADIIIENYRPGVLHKFGLNYDNLRKTNTRLIYCSISGYGQEGSYAQRGAFDVTIQAISGLMSVTGEESGDPVKAGVPVADFAAGLYAAYSIMALVRKREFDKRGGYIDCSMLGSVLGMSALQTSEFYGTGKSPKRLGSAHPRNAPYQGFHAKDKPFVIAAGNDSLWERVTVIVNLPSLLDDKRFKTQHLRAINQKELAVILNDVFKNETAEYWLNKCVDLGIPCAPINDFERVLKDEHVEEMGIIGDLRLPNNVETKYVGFPVKLSNFDFEVYLQPPKLGEHNEEVYKEWGV